MPSSSAFITTKFMVHVVITDWDAKDTIWWWYKSCCVGGVWKCGCLAASNRSDLIQVRLQTYTLPFSLIQILMTPPHVHLCIEKIDGAWGRYWFWRVWQKVALEVYTSSHRWKCQSTSTFLSHALSLSLYAITSIGCAGAMIVQTWWWHKMWDLV